MRPLLGLVSPVALAFLLTVAGCATRGDVRRLREDIAREHDSLGIQVADLSRSVAAMDSTLRRQEETIRRTGADLGTEMATLSSRTNSLEGKVIETGSRLSRLGMKVDTSYIYGGSRPPEQSPKTDSLSSPAAPARGVVGLQDPKRLYDTAYQDLTGKNYDLAIAEFSQYISTYPDTDLWDNAQYWLGECYYAQRKYPEARKVFEKLISSSPDSEKLAAARLKIGYSFAEENDRAGAIRQLRALIQSHPKTGEAEKAAQKIKELTAKKR